MYFIVERRHDGELELKTLEYCLGPAIHQESENYLNRLITRAAFFDVCSEAWKKKYSSTQAHEMAEAFLATHMFFASEEDLPFLAALLEYDRLRPLDRREARDRRIEDLFREHLGASDAYAPHLMIAKSCAFIYPDHLITREINNVCVTLAKGSDEELKLRKAVYLTRFSQAQLPDMNFWFGKFIEAQRFYSYTGLANATDAWIALARQGTAGRNKCTYLETHLVGNEKSFDHLACHALLMLRAADLSLTNLKKEAKAAYSRSRQYASDLDSTSSYVFQEALKSDFDFGPQGERNRSFMREHELTVAAALENLRPQIEERRKKAIEPQKQQTEDDGAEEALWAWPIDKIVDYIGPVGRKGRGRKKQKKKKNSNSMPSVEVPSSSGDVVPLTDDVLIVPENDQAMVELGLRNSLAFFQQEASSALTLATEMKLQSTTVDGLNDCCVQMAILAEDDDLQSGKIESCFERVTDFLSQLRYEIALREKDEDLVRSFNDALMDACCRERAVYGKRYGGLIEHPLDLQDWTLINERYHNRMIRGRSKIRIGRKVRYLRDDEALVFYVTFTSLSGYAFDISAHLWRRYEDAGNVRPTLPSEDLHAPMDQDNWYDTFIPCFVLHVPYRH